jgi:hypothetical protein
MPNPSPAFQAKVEQLTSSFAGELMQVMKEAIVAAVADAVGSAPSAPARRGRPPKAATASVIAPIKKGQRRGPEELARTSARLYAEISSRPGQRIEQIAKTLKCRTKELALPVAKLFDDGKIKTKGQRRATAYFPT